MYSSLPKYTQKESKFNTEQFSVKYFVNGLRTLLPCSQKISWFVVVVVFCQNKVNYKI